MKHLLLTTIAAVLVVGCGESQQSAPAPESKPVEPVAEAAKPEPPTAKAPDISIHKAAEEGNIEAVKQHIAAGTDVNAKDEEGETPLHHAAWEGHKEVAQLLIAKGADVNAKNNVGDTPLDLATHLSNPNASPEIADLIRKQGAKTGEVLKVEGTSFNQMPEIDLSSFTEEQQATILVRANKENCDCGCKMTVAECRNDDTSCRTSVRLAKAIVEEVTGEKPKNESKAKGAKTGEELKAEGK